MASDNVKPLAFDLPFAKVVSTQTGDALLVGGNVFHVQGPDGNAANVFASALRSLGVEVHPNTPGDGAKTPYGSGLSGHWVWRSTVCD